MFQCLESIKLKDGEFFRLKYHQQRMDKAVRLLFPDAPMIDLAAYLRKSNFPTHGVYKCRIVYDKLIQLLEFIPYQIRPVRTLQFIDTTLEATVYKPQDRSEITKLFAQRGENDDVLMVKDGLLSDTSYCNIALFNGIKWISPRVPIVYGTQRAYLIDSNDIVEQDIPFESFLDYQKIRLFNAMIEFGELELNIM